MLLKMQVNLLLDPALVWTAYCLSLLGLAQACLCNNGMKHAMDYLMKKALENVHETTMSLTCSKLNNRNSTIFIIQDLGATNPGCVTVPHGWVWLAQCSCHWTLVMKFGHEKLSWVQPLNYSQSDGADGKMARICSTRVLEARAADCMKFSKSGASW